jgi:hypothetical protein
MFHARIVSPHGSLYLAAEATQYDLENLRTHVDDARTRARTATRLELSLDAGSDAVRERVATLLLQLEAKGVQVTMSPAPVALPDEACGVPRFRRLPHDSR